MILDSNIKKFFIFLLDDENLSLDEFINNIESYRNLETNELLIHYRIANELGKVKKIFNEDANKIDGALIDFILHKSDLSYDSMDSAIVLAGGEDKIKDLENGKLTTLGGLAAVVIFLTSRMNKDFKSKNLIDPFIYIYTGRDIEKLRTTFDRSIVYDLIIALTEEYVNVGKPQYNEVIIEFINHCRREYLKKLSSKDKYQFLLLISELYENLMKFSPNKEKRFDESFDIISEIFLKEDQFSYLIPDIISLPYSSGSSRIKYETNLKPMFEPIIQEVIDSFENQSHEVANFYQEIDTSKPHLTHPDREDFSFTKKDKTFLFATLENYKSSLIIDSIHNFEEIFDKLSDSKVDNSRKLLTEAKRVLFRFNLTTLLSGVAKKMSIVFEINNEEYNNMEFYGDSKYIYNVVNSLIEQCKQENSSVYKISIQKIEDCEPYQEEGMVLSKSVIKIHFDPIKKDELPDFRPFKGHYNIANLKLLGYGSLFFYWDKNKFDFAKMSWQAISGEKDEFYYKIELYLIKSNG